MTETKKVATDPQTSASVKKSSTAWSKSSSSNADIMAKYSHMLQFVRNTLQGLEHDIKRIHQVVQQLEKFDPSNSDSLAFENTIQEVIGMQDMKKYDDVDAQVIEGVFDGYFMVGVDQKKYPVPLNYASKTKLVPGDALKLKIMSDGKFVYKLMRAVERNHVRAILSVSDDNKYTAITDEWQPYFLNQAAVTFFKGKAGDELYIVTNADGSWSFAAIEAIIKK